MTTTVTLDNQAIADAFERQYFQEVMAIFVSADEEYCERFLAPHLPRLYKHTDILMHKDLSTILKAQPAQIYIVANMYALLNIIEITKVKSESSGGANNLNVYRIKRDNGNAPQFLNRSFFNFDSQKWLTTLQNAENYFKMKD